MLLTEIAQRLHFLHKVGLGYLTLDRPRKRSPAAKLQRARLATHLGGGLFGVCYILDEPTMGLHSRDTERLLAALRDLQALGNTLIVVEHDETLIRAADWLIDIGPGAGRHGGPLLAEGPVADYSASTLFPDGISSAFDFDSAYHPRDTMSNGKGYWMKFASPHLTTMTGLSVDTLEITVREGWNMIGTLSQPIPAPASPDIVSVFYEYSAGYHRADTLLPGRGYWVKVASDGILALGMSAQKTPASADPPAEPPSVTIRSSNGGSSTLYFFPAGSGYHPGEFDLPPPPPVPAFDARFAGGGDAVLLPAEPAPVREFIVEIQSDAASISISGDRGGSPLEFEAETGPDQWTAITGTSEPVAFTKHPGRIFIKLRAVVPAHEPPAVPEAFLVAGSYPNPFNPSAVIEYQLPGEAVVTLRVSDSGGRTVFLSGPVSEGPGRHRFAFDAGERGLAGGIYFFTVRAEGIGTGRTFSGSGKMIFLK